MTRFKIILLIGKPVDIVTKALSNPDNHPYWTSDLEKFEIIKGNPNEVGSIALLHYAQKGHKYIMEDKLVYCEPGKKYISQVTGDAISAEVETILMPRGYMTEMRMKWSGKGKNLILKLFLPLFRSRIKKLARKDLRMFKKLVEERGEDFNAKI